MVSEGKEIAMNTLGRGAVCSLAALGLIGPTRGGGGAPAAEWILRVRPGAAVELELPAGLKQVSVDCDDLVGGAATHQFQANGHVRITFSDGVRLLAPQARVAPADAGSGGGHIAADLLNDTEVELELPAGVNVGLVAGGALFYQGAGTMRTDGPATISLSNGLRLRTRQARVTLVLARPGSRSRILIEPLPGPPTPK
jgi:hypothetical protein